MKLELLFVLAVAALVPSFSESRIVSKCELRDDLGKIITLKKKLVPYKDQILAVVICEVEMRSHFNTNLVTVYGDRKPTTTATPTTLPTAGNNVTIVDTTTTSTTNSTTTTSPSTANPIVDTTTTSTTNSTTTTSPSTANATITNSGSASNITASGSRKKRDAPRENKKKSKSKESLVSSDEKEMEDDEYEDEDDEEDSPENKPMMGSSLGYYGIFQLSDSHFCDSGYRSSKNLCRSSCSAFTDDDITDDVACVVGSGYWKHLLDEASKQCQRAKKTYFAECAA